MERVKADDAGLQEAVRILTNGGVAVIPTDTVYGLAAHPAFPAAVERLYAIKARAAKKPIALLAADADAAARFLGGLDAQARRLAERHWPGALTQVLPKVERSQGGDALATGNQRGDALATGNQRGDALATGNQRGDALATGMVRETVFEGLRVPDHDWTRRLLAACGGVLRVTSANMSGARPATDAEAALADVGLSADLVVDDGISPGGVASTVVKVADGHIAVLRRGPVDFLVLASGSPRRAKILDAAGVDFTVVKSEAPEVSYPHDPERTVSDNARAKAEAVRATLPADARVLAADTIVWYDGTIYGKPRDLDEAKSFLRTLSGQTHTVFTGVAYGDEVRVVRSDVTFQRLSDAAIDDYVARVRPTDRAGAYDIDESGSLIVASYTGEYENIMGLPLAPLKDWGIV